MALSVHGVNEWIDTVNQGCGHGVPSGVQMKGNIYCRDLHTDLSVPGVSFVFWLAPCAGMKLAASG